MGISGYMTEIVEEGLSLSNNETFYDGLSTQSPVRASFSPACQDPAWNAASLHHPVLL